MYESIDRKLYWSVAMVIMLLVSTDQHGNWLWEADRFINFRRTQLRELIPLGSYTPLQQKFRSSELIMVMRSMERAGEIDLTGNLDATSEFLLRINYERIMQKLEQAQREALVDAAIDVCYGQ